MDNGTIIGNLYHILVMLAFAIIHAFLDIYQKACWKITGYPSGCNYKDGRCQGCIEAFDILLRSPDPSVRPTLLSRYLYKHHGFYSLDYLLNPKVSLFTFKDEYVYFIEASDPDELYNTRRFPFFFLAQQSLGQKILKVHSGDLIEFTEKLPKPEMQVLWIFHSSRCGSTAMIQAVNATGQFKAISEIPWMNHLLPKRLYGTSYQAIKEYMSSSMIKQIAKACIVSQLIKFQPHEKVCWKAHYTNEPYLLPILAEIFPSHKILFMTRRGDETAISISRSNRDPIPAYIITKLCSALGERLFSFSFGKSLLTLLTNGMLNPATKELLSERYISTFLLCYMLWGSYMALLIDLARNCPHIKLMVIDYNVLMSDLDTNLRKVFQYANIDEAGFQLALNSFKEDSQANTSFAKSILQSCTGTFDPDMRTIRICEKFSAAMGLPEFGKSPTKEFFGIEHWTYLTN